MLKKLHVKKSKITCTPHPTIDRSSQLLLRRSMWTSTVKLKTSWILFLENSQQANEIDIESDSDEEQSNSVLC